jgi:uncharacterized protein involved in exopolysaccharide biosynthesis
MQATQAEHALAPAEQYLRALWRGKWLFLVIVAAAVGIALVVTALLPKSYASEIILSVRPAPPLEAAATLYGSAMVGLPRLKAEDPEDQGPIRMKRLLQASGLVTLAARDVGVIGATETVEPRQVSKWIEAQEVLKTDLLTVSVWQPTAEGAHRFATALVTHAAEAARPEATADPSMRHFLEVELHRATADVSQAETAVMQVSAGHAPDRDIALDRAKLDLSLARDQYAAVRKRLGVLSLILANQQYQMTVVDQPTLPMRPAFPRPLLNVSIGLIIGVLAATTFIVLRSIFRGA